MSIPVQITFRGIQPSDALRASIEKHAAKLERFSKNLLGCKVVVEQAEGRHHHGNRFRLHVQLDVTGRSLQAGREPPAEDQAATDPYVAVRDSFEALQRQLEDYERIRRGD